MCDIALHGCNVFLMSVIGVIEWAPAWDWEREWAYWDLSKLTGWQERGGVSMHITRRRQNSFCNALAEREESFGNDYPPTTDEKRDHKFLRQCAATHE